MKSFEVRNKEILHACQCARSCYGINGNDNGKDDQNRHHHLGNAFNAVSHTGVDDGDRNKAENGKTELCGNSV